MVCPLFLLVHLPAKSIRSGGLPGSVPGGSSASAGLFALILPLEARRKGFFSENMAKETQKASFAILLMDSFRHICR